MAQISPLTPEDREPQKDVALSPQAGRAQEEAIVPQEAGGVPEKKPLRFRIGVGLLVV